MKELLDDMIGKSWKWRLITVLGLLLVVWVMAMAIANAIQGG